MKYVVDIDALIECLDCLDSIRVNGELYISIPLLKEFINRFPKDTVEIEPAELDIAKEIREQFNSGL